MVGGEPLTRAMIETREMVDAIAGYVPSTEQCVRLRGPKDAEGVVQYHELKFTLMRRASKKWSGTNPSYTPCTLLRTSCCLISLQMRQIPHVLFQTNQA